MLGKDENQGVGIMSNTNKNLISHDTGQLQIPYAEYVTLIEKVEEGLRLNQVKDAVLADLKLFEEGTPSAQTSSPAKPKAKKIAPKKEKVAVEFNADESVVEASNSADTSKTPENSKASSKGRAAPVAISIPPIKKDVSVHFNQLDESGRLFSVFKQYYTCLNDACGGTVRVTMKDGLCSFWNYDEWEEFAFIDILEGNLRISVDPRYTKALLSLNLCEVPRLLSSRRSMVSVLVDDLNNTMLDLLAKAFKEVGLPAS